MASEHKVNILMVDDQPGKLLSYEVILAELGENLLKATSARDALEQLLKNDVAVVLMDVSMPDIDGFELAEMIRQHPRYQRTAIIFISAVHLTDLDRLKGYQRGAVDYISVPVVPELLRAKVSVFAELFRKNQELQALNRDLELRVAERTAEIERRTEALELLNAQLARKNQELDAIFKTAPDIIFSSKPDGHSDYISGRFHEYTGAQNGASSGANILEYVHPDDLERSVAQWSRSIEKGENYECEYRLRSKNGDYRWFRARALPIRDHAGDVARWPDPHSGERMRIEHWVLAERQGQVAALNMLGERKRFDAVPFFWSQHFDVTIRYVGHAEKWDGIEVVGSLDARDASVSFVRDGRVTAVATVGRDRTCLEAELALEKTEETGRR